MGLLVLNLKRMCFTIVFAIGFWVYDLYQIKKVTFCLLGVFIIRQGGQRGSTVIIFHSATDQLLMFTANSRYGRSQQA